MRPVPVLPSARMRVSIFECAASGIISSGEENMASISATDTPCFWHLARFPASQSNPVMVSAIRRYYTNVYTNATRTQGRRRQSGLNRCAVAPRNASNITTLYLMYSGSYQALSAENIGQRQRRKARISNILDANEAQPSNQVVGSANLSGRAYRLNFCWPRRAHGFLLKIEPPTDKKRVRRQRRSPAMAIARGRAER